MWQFRHWLISRRCRSNSRRLGNKGQVKQTMTTVLPRGVLDQADQGAPSPLEAVRCNLARNVANQGVRVADFRDTVLRPSKKMPAE
jgi:hypothetical protein